MAEAYSTTTTVRSDQDPNHRLEPSTLRLLADYDIHHSRENQIETPGSRVEVVQGIWREAQPAEFDPTLAPHPLVPYPVTNPGWWQRAYRRVPDYRPINTELDFEQRRQGPMFHIIGGIMIRGCSLITLWALVWRHTAGHFTDYGKTVVGGEW